MMMSKSALHIFIHSGDFGVICMQTMEEEGTSKAQAGNEAWRRLNGRRRPRTVINHIEVFNCRWRSRNIARTSNNILKMMRIFDFMILGTSFEAFHCQL